MTLFKSLANTPIGDDSTSSSSTEKNPAFPPTAVQLYSSKYIHFISDTIQKFYDNDTSAAMDNGNGSTDHETNNGIDSGDNDNEHHLHGARNRISKKDFKTLPKRYEILSYQPVHVPDATASSTASSSNTSTATTPNTTPNLGVWDCRFTSFSSSTSTSTISKSTSYLLKSALYHQNNTKNNVQKPTFVLTIDLESIEDVHTTLSTMMESVARSMGIGMGIEVGVVAGAGEQREGKEEEKQQQQQLQDSLPKFGIAPSSRENDTLKIKEDLFNNVNIIICAILPYSITCKGGANNNKNTAMTYKEKQGLNLILYHLLKYANALNCTLCFLNQNDTYEEDDDDNADSGIGAEVNGNNGGEGDNGDDGKSLGGSHGLVPRGMSVKEFKHVLRAICFGIANNSNADTSTFYYDQVVSSILNKSAVQLGGGIVNGNDNVSMSNEGLGTIDEEKEQKDDDEANNDEKLVQMQTSIYLPGGYDEDLIESVYLRSASCAGVWDANTDNLWVALPSTSTSTLSNSNNVSPQKGGSKSSGSGGDEEWLSKLADSVSAYIGVGNLDATKSSAMEEGSMKSGKTKIKDGSSVVTTSTKNKRVGRKKPSGASSKKTGDKDDVSDFFTDLLKN